MPVTQRRYEIPDDVLLDECRHAISLAEDDAENGEADANPDWGYIDHGWLVVDDPAEAVYRLTSCRDILKDWAAECVDPEESPAKRSYLRLARRVDNLAKVIVADFGADNIPDNARRWL